MKRQISNTEKDEIRKCRKLGMSYGKISKKYRLNKSTVEKIVKTDGRLVRKRGRKEVLNKQDIRRMRTYIEISLKEGKKVSSANIIRDLNLNASRSTVCRRLKYVDYVYNKLKPKKTLSRKYRQNRVQLARHYIERNIDWFKVAFSDEKRFSLDGCDHYQTWFGKNINYRYAKKVTKSPSIMVWALILPNGLLSFRIVPGRFNSDKYIDILQNTALKILKLNNYNDIIFQQDNSSIHSSKKTGLFFRKHNVNVLKWPPFSPDLNIIENIWSLIERYIYADGKAKNLKDLKYKITNAVIYLNEKKTSEMMNLYKSLPHRICDLLMTGGSRLKY